MSPVFRSNPGAGVIDFGYEIFVGVKQYSRGKLRV
jgi:hypothetical protein